MMRKKFYQIVCAGFIIASLTGCGGEHGQAGVSESVSGSAVSGGAVSGQAVSDGTVWESQEESTGKAHRYCTDSNLYMESDDGDEYEYFFQTRLNGSNRKKIYIRNFSSLLGVEGKYLYYIESRIVREGECNRDSICRVPIQKDGNGYDVVRTDQPETVICGEKDNNIEEMNAYLDSQYIVYFDSPKQTVVKYDLEAEKKVSEVVWENDVELCLDRCGSYFIAHDEMNDEFFYQGVADTEWKKLVEKDIKYTVGDEYIICGEDVCFFLSWDEPPSGRNDADETDEIITKWDLKNEKNTPFITSKQLEQAVAEAEELDLESGSVDFCVITNMYFQNGRLYVQVQTSLIEGEIYRMAYALFSQAPDETELHYEKEITECMRSCGTVREGKWLTGSDYRDKEKRLAVEHAVINDARCFRIINRKAFFCIYDYEEDKGRMGRYDMNTGQFRWLTKEDEEYYEPCYEPNSNFELFGATLENEDMNADCNFIYIPFRRDGEYAEWFVEFEKTEK